MPKSKIPLKLKNGLNVGSGRFVVFKGLLSAGPAFIALQKKKKVFPYGYITVKKERYYYCLYGLIDEDYIWAKK